eukprot:scaffold803_cov310-Pinguiococcus_pyrenoidosus.AAC.36
MNLDRSMLFHRLPLLCRRNAMDDAETRLMLLSSTRLMLLSSTRLMLLSSTRLMLLRDATDMLDYEGDQRSPALWASLGKLLLVPQMVVIGAGSLTPRSRQRSVRGRGVRETLCTVLPMLHAVKKANAAARRRQDAMAKLQKTGHPRL